MHRQRGVYFFDEFDAIGADRGASNDVGEIRRVLNSFLQFLEQDDSDSLVIAATNFIEMLDDALFRRFDDVVVYEKPDDDEVRKLISNRLRNYLGKRIAWKRVLQAATGLSHAEIARACDDALKDCILASRSSVNSDELVMALAERHRPVFKRKGRAIARRKFTSA